MNNLLISVQDDFIKNAGDRPSLGIGYLANYLKSNDIPCDIYDMNVNSSYADLMRHILSNNYKNIGISLTTPQYKEANSLGYALKLNFPNKNLIAGGAHPTAVNGDMPNFWDYIVVGDGEYALEDIILNKTKDRIVYGQKVKNLDILPKAYRDKDLMDKYSLNINGKKATSLMTSRGCVYHCSFCSEPHLNKGYRKHSPEYVLNEMKYLKNNFGIEALIIYDDIYAIDPKRTRKIAQGMIDNNLDMIYRATTRASDILRDPDMLPLMKDSGCIELCLGVESGDNKILRLNDKGMTTRDNMKALNLIKKAGINTLSYMITGLPGFSAKSEDKSLEFLKRAEVDEAGWYLLAPFPSSDLWRNSKKYGINIFKEEIIRNDWDITQVTKDNENMKCYFEYPNMPREKIKDIWLDKLRKWEEYKKW